MSCVKAGSLVLGDGIPKICVPLVKREKQDLLKAAVRARDAGADLVEWRVDFYERADNAADTECMLNQIVKVLETVPLLFTFRTAAEGGEREIDEKLYWQLNRMAASKAALVDVEIDRPDSRSLMREIRKMGGRVIASNHNFAATPSNIFMEKKLQQMEEAGADILKLAVMPRTEMDVIRLLQVTAERKALTQCPVITMSMSRMGLISRISGTLTGSALTFASLEEVSAPGQIPLDVMREILGHMNG